MHPEPTLFGLTTEQLAEAAKEAGRRAILKSVNAGIPVTGLFEGKVQTLSPTDPRIQRLVQVLEVNGRERSSFTS